MHGNINLASIVQPSITTGVPVYDVAGCALPQAEVDEIFSFLNTFFSSNTPIKNLTVRTNGGTNASPTGGAANTDIVNLDTVVYPATAFDFIYSIN